MKNIEKRRINLVKTSNGERGSLWLKKLAIPETVKVTVNGEKVVPVSISTVSRFFPKSSAR